MYAKPGTLEWYTTPKTACDNLMKQKIAAGMTKANVLKEDRKATAVAFIRVQAWADSKANNKKNSHSNGAAFSLSDTAYQVIVVCRAAL